MKKLFIHSILAALLFNFNMTFSQVENIPIEENDINYLVEVVAIRSIESYPNSIILSDISQLTPTNFLADLQCDSFTCTKQYTDNGVKYDRELKVKQYYLSNNSLIELEFTFDSHGPIVGSWEIIKNSFSFDFTGTSIDLYFYKTIEWSDNNINYKAEGAVIVHPLCTISLPNRFIKVNNDLKVKFTRKKTTYNYAGTREPLLSNKN